ncbi:MAG: 4a-hydroxytetrahydrobiopterin dehydratase [Parcubacteria group bacterium Gr01-1014_107]|nr:MAG: 4a-hydroxytetrahydrobiopterin dehydratase [Parcubacteria group bacterium Gr01-1014_107]
MLKDKKCQPCEGGVVPLNSEKARELLKELNQWVLVDNKRIEKVFSFNNFKEALAFVNKVGELAEVEGHHPGISLFSWNKVKIVTSTHAIKGLSENDFILASKIDFLH